MSSLSTLVKSPNDAASRNTLRRQFSKNVADLSVSDLSDVVITFFSIGENEEKILKEPLVLTPELTECGQYMTLEISDWGISVIAETREELLEELKEDLRVQWNYCAIEQDDKLGKMMRKYKHNLLAAVV